jgi:hypothetical protein
MFLGYQLQPTVISKGAELNTCKKSTFVDLLELFPNLTNLFEFGQAIKNDSKKLTSGNYNFSFVLF